MSHSDRAIYWSYVRFCAAVQVEPWNLADWHTWSMPGVIAHWKSWERSFKTNQRETQHESKTFHGGFLLAEMLGAHECTLEGLGNEAPCYSHQGQEMSMERENVWRNPV